MSPATSHVTARLRACTENSAARPPRALTIPLRRRATFRMEPLCAGALRRCPPDPSRERPMLDILFIALGAGVLALFGAYARALRRL